MRHMTTELIDGPRSAIEVRLIAMMLVENANDGAAIHLRRRGVKEASQLLRTKLARPTPSMMPIGLTKLSATLGLDVRSTRSISRSSRSCQRQHIN